MGKRLHPRPRRLRPRVGIKTTLDKKLAISAVYVAAQATSDPQNQLGGEAAALSAARALVIDTLTKKAEINALAVANQSALVRALDAHDERAREYAHAAAKVAAGEVSVLTTLGVTAASSPTKGSDVGAPQRLAILHGPAPGDADLKCGRAPGAGSYLFQYKLEPSEPTDPWLPEGGIMTKHVSARVPGLAPGQKLRARARAIGVTPGPWSDEVIGEAR